MFAMRYCKKCLESYRPETEGLGEEEYLMLNIPVADDYGLIFRAFMAIMAGDFLRLLESDEEVIDLSQHTHLMRVEMPEGSAAHRVYH